MVRWSEAQLLQPPITPLMHQMNAVAVDRRRSSMDLQIYLCSLLLVLKAVVLFGPLLNGLTHVHAISSHRIILLTDAVEPL